MGKKQFIGQIQEFHAFNRYGQKTKEAIALDLTDRKILYLLGENSRFSTSAIAKALRLSRETVGYRIKRMEDHGFLHGYLTLLNHRKLGLKNYLIYLKLASLVRESELLAYFQMVPEVTRLKNCSGRYDLQLVFSVAKEEECCALLEDAMKRFHDCIDQYDLHEILEENFLGLGLLLPENHPSIKEHKGSSFHKLFGRQVHHSGSYSCDEKDRKILNILKLQATISIKELSATVSLAPIAVERRVQRLVKEGVIKSFIPIASLHQLGYQWWKVFLTFKGIDQKKLITYLKFHPNILWYMKLLGGWNYQISVFAKDNAEFHRVLDDIRSTFKDELLKYDAIIIFNQLKYVQRVD